MTRPMVKTSISLSFKYALCHSSNTASDDFLNTDLKFREDINPLVEVRILDRSLRPFFAVLPSVRSADGCALFSYQPTWQRARNCFMWHYSRNLHSFQLKPTSNRSKALSPFRFLTSLSAPCSISFRATSRFPT